MPVLCKKLSRTRIVFTYDGELRDEEIEASHRDWLGFLAEAQAEGRRVVLLVDGGGSKGMNARQRRITSDFADEHETLIAQVCAAQAVVLKSAIQRGVLTASSGFDRPRRC